MLESKRAASTATEARRLRLAEEGEVLHVTRLRTLDGRAVMIERTTYAPWVASKIEGMDADEPSVVDALEVQFGIITAFGSHAIDAVAASSEDARLLDIRRTSLLLRVRRESSAKDGRVVELGEDRYLTDTITFQVTASIGRRVRSWLLGLLGNSELVAPGMVARPPGWILTLSPTCLTPES